MTYTWEITYYKNSQPYSVKLTSDLWSLASSLSNAQIFDYEIIEIKKSVNTQT